ncbi:MAG TPA: hypothetical protein PKH02_02485 [Bacteroidales bacterium]|nr:hypothetical protein [Bacteroidales bacterium]HPT10979.1 hypothetical protein [Bacteroidales bacterium]
MKKSILFLVVLAMMHSAVLMAQQGRPGGKHPQLAKPEEMATRSSEKIAKDLDLNKSDYEKVYQIELERFKAQDARMQESMKNGDRLDFNSLKKIDEDRNKKLKDLLGEERFKKIKDSEKGMRMMEPMKRD